MVRFYDLKGLFQPWQFHDCQGLCCSQVPSSPCAVQAHRKDFGFLSIPVHILEEISGDPPWKEGKQLEAALREQRWPGQGQPLLRGLFLAFFVTAQQKPLSMTTAGHRAASFFSCQAAAPAHPSPQPRRGAWRGFCFPHSMQEGMNHSHTSLALTRQKQQLLCYLLPLDGCSTSLFLL